MTELTAPPTPSRGMRQPIERNVAMELMRVTEAAAMSAARFMGRGDKIGADQAAVDAMRHSLNSVAMDGIVVIGEGLKDEAPMLYIGEQIGNGFPPNVDIAVDPIDGTRLLSRGLPNAIAVVALSERDTMLNVPPELVYLDKIAVGSVGRGLIDIGRPVEENIRILAEAKGVAPAELAVVILDRERNEGALAAIRRAGARVKMITDGDVAGSIMAALPEESGVDMLVGVGGSPEAIISATAIKCLGGDMQCRPWPRDDGEIAACRAADFEIDHTYEIDELVGSDDLFFSATGITDGELLRGVRYGRSGGQTHSLVMRSHSGTIRWIEARHDFSKLKEISGEMYYAEQ